MFKKYIKKKSLKLLANGIFYGFGITAGTILGYIFGRKSNTKETVDGDIFIVDCGDGEEFTYASFDLPFDIISKKNYIRLKVNNKTIDKKNTPMFREIPCNKDIYYANTLIKINNFGYKESNIFGAIILKWVKANKIEFKNEKTGIFNKESGIIDLTKNPQFDNFYEKELFDMMYEASKDGILETREFEKWCKSNYSEFLDLFEKIENKKVNELKEEGHIYKRTNRHECKKKNVMDDKIYEDSTQLITTREGLHKYIDTAISNGVIAIDTETNNSLQPVGCKLMGACIYTPGLKNVYIPINHINHNTGELLDNQLTEKDIYEEFSRLNDNVKCITHNGKFDYEVLKYTTGWKMPIYWDTMIGARILDENERASLKLQYISKIDPTVEKYSIDHLFEGVEYAVVDPKLFALYAATDAYMTYKLYLYQVKEFEKPDNAKLYNLFMNIEMPDVEVFAEMELAGVELSLSYAERLKIKYGKMLDDLQKKIDIEFEKYNKQIEEWRLTPEANYHPPKASGEGFDKSLSEKLQTPINTSSSLQMAIFFYDVLKMPVVDKKKPRGTGEDILTQFKLPICDLILEYRGLSKLISTYIDALPNAVNPVDGRVHCQYNQIGAGTGRVSSDNPNMQNIPSNNRELRMLFKAAEGNVMVGADFSLQLVG